MLSNGLYTQKSSGIMLSQMRNQFNQREQLHYQPQLQVTLDLRQEPEWTDELPHIKKHNNHESFKVASESKYPKFSPSLDLLKNSCKTQKNIQRRVWQSKFNRKQECCSTKYLQVRKIIQENNTLMSCINIHLPINISKNKQEKQSTMHRWRCKMTSISKYRKGKFKDKRGTELNGKDRSLPLHQNKGRTGNSQSTQVKNKVGNLKQQIEAQYLQNKIRQQLDIDGIIQKHYYSIEHPRTKEAELFVKGMQQKRKEEKRYYQSIQASKREEEQYQRLKLAQSKQMQLQEKRTKLHQFYQNKLQKRLEEKHRQNLKKQEFKEWMKQYHREKPLQIQKEEEFRMKVLIPKLEERHKKLMTIRAEHKPIDTDQIMEHESKYLDFKKDDQIRKKAELQMISEENNMRGQDLAERLYKGKYRYLILEQIVEQKYPIDNRQIEQSKKDRIRAYNDQIRQYHKQMNQQKHNEKIEGDTIGNKKFMRRVRNMNGSLTVSNRNSISGGSDDKEIQSLRNQRKHSEDFDAKKHGRQNLAFLKSMIRQQAIQHQENKPLINFVQENVIEKPKGYLQLQRQKRLVKPKEQNSINKDLPQTDVTVTANQQISAVKSKAELIDVRLKRKEIKLKNNKGGIGIYQAGQQVEKDYVQAIKTKIQILNQFD